MTLFVSRLRKQADVDGHRALLVVENASTDYLDTAAKSINAPFLAARHSEDRVDRINAVLGREFDILVHETGEVIDAGLLAALAGTIRAGGILILGLPFGMSTSESNTAPPCPPQSRFNRRLARLLRQSHRMNPQKVAFFDPENDHKLAAELPETDISSGNTTLIDPPASPLPTDPTITQSIAQQEQDALLLDAIKHLQRHPRGCITITGRRGRGKSALMGRIARSLHDKGLSVAMTSARRTALQSMQRHGADAVFLPPDEVALSGCQVLLVDEAASLPIDTLTRFLQHHEQVVYCSTIEGYENAGRAFGIRFAEVLDQHHRQRLSLQPLSAWRWAAGDPLEAIVDTLLLTRHNQAPESRTEQAEGSAIASASHARSTREAHLRAPHQHLRVQRLRRDALIADEPLLASVFSLLRDHHYQTSASDISHLLDGPGLQIWVLEEHGDLCAALLLAIEGHIAPDLHEPILSKQRRVQHQLLPQLLAQSANQAAPLTHLMGRVIRIAVMPEKRRNGLGTQLLQNVVRRISVPDGHLSAIGASFAGDSSSIAFWNANGFRRFHTGFRRNPRTGTQAVAVLQAHEPELSASLQEAVRIHDDNQAYLSGEASSDGYDPTDIALLQRFARAQRSLVDTYAALSRLAKQHPLSLVTPPERSRREHESALRASVELVLQTGADSATP